MKSVLYRPSWQKLRVSCLAQNHPQGGFNTNEGTQDNLMRLNNYIGDAASLVEGVKQENLRMGFTQEEEYACRIWRVLNLLNAVRMGYHGIGRVGTPGDEAVRKYRDSVQLQHDGGRVVTAENKWNWDVVQTELEELWVVERVWFTRVYNDLNRRRKVATNRRKKVGTNDVDATRPELIKFLTLMEEINRHASS